MLLIEHTDTQRYGQKLDNGMIRSEWWVGAYVAAIDPFKIHRIQCDGDEMMHVKHNFSFCTIIEKKAIIIPSIPWNYNSNIQVWYGDIARSIFESLTTNNVKDE